MTSVLPKPTLNLGARFNVNLKNTPNISANLEIGAITKMRRGKLFSFKISDNK